MLFAWRVNSDGTIRSAYPLGDYTAPPAPPGGGDNYDYSAYPVTHIVDPTATVVGTGSEASPLTIAQAQALSTVSSYVHCEWKPGAGAIALLDSKWPAVRPSNSGSATRPIIHRARNPAISTPNQADRTRFTRASGEGSFFGVGIDGLSFSNIIWDGFESLDYCNRNNGDRFACSVWGATDIAIRRCIIENGGGATGNQDNHGCLWGQDVTGLEIGDCEIGNNTTGQGYENNCALMFYDVNGADIHHCDIYDSDGLVFFKGLHGGFTMRDNTVRLCNLTGGTKAGILYSSTDGGTTFADLLRIHQNIISTCMWGFWVNGYGVGYPNGVAVVNNLVRNCTSAYLLKPGVEGSYDPLLINRNNIFYDNSQAGVESQDTNWASSHTDFDFDHNAFHSNGTVYREQGSSRDWTYWTGLGNDANGTTDDPTFVDAAGGDYRLETGSTLFDAGVDYLQLLGGSQSAAINIGPYISASQDEVIGVRT